MFDSQNFEDGQGPGRHGFYCVGNKKFYYKASALVHASIHKLPVTWEFNNDVFAEQVAKPRLPISLPELYRLRCQQIRDQYDYVILAYSGGADSNTILRSYLDNNIRLDEVWFDQPFEFIEKSNYTPTLSTDPINLVSEWFFVVKPDLEQLQVSNPEIKIHVSDACKTPDIEDFEDTFQYTFSYTYNGIKRWRYMKNYIEKLQERHKKVCVILGTDKCIPFYHQGSYGFSFKDLPTNIKHPFIEYFYWTPSMPEIAVQQAYEVWDQLQHNTRLLIQKKMSSKKDPNDYIRRDQYDQFIKSVIYPTWDPGRHQVDKMTIFLGKGFSVFVDRWSQERFYQSWASNVQHTFKSIDPTMYTNGRDPTDDFKSFAVNYTLGKNFR